MSYWNVRGFKLHQPTQYSVGDSIAAQVAARDFHKLDIEFELDSEALEVFLSFMDTIGCNHIRQKIQKQLPVARKLPPRSGAVAIDVSDWEEEPPTYVPPSRKTTLK